MSQGLVDKQESAMEGRGKSILGSDNGRCKGPKVGACLVCWRIKKACSAGVGQVRGEGRRWCGRGRPSSLLWQDLEFYFEW